ncbi:MAG: FimB/Mfa2 family fimbrial subunit, partial [Clostridium sp.]|nr:FimB/Mfa2 family fimbrial subunit [Clostridium sp.]
MMVKKVISAFLSLFIFAQSVILFAPVKAAGTNAGETAASSLPSEQTVLNLKENLRINTHVTYDGDIVNSDSGKKIIVESGSLFISRNTVVNVDIELRGKAVLIIEGSVHATVTISTTSSPSASGIQNGNNNFELHPQGFVEEIVLDQRYGVGRIEGSVDYLAFHEKSGGTISLSPNANIDTIDYQSSTKTTQTIMGNIARLNIHSGSVNLQQATVTTVVRKNNANLTIKPSGSVTTLISRNAEGRSGEVTTAGRVNTLYAEASHTTNTGYIQNAFLQNATYEAHRDSSGVTEAYLTENIFASDDSSLVMRADSPARATIGTLHLHNSSMELANINMEYAYVSGELKASNIQNVAIGKLFFEAEQEGAVALLGLANTSKVSASYVEMSEDVFDKNLDAAALLMALDNTDSGDIRVSKEWYEKSITKVKAISPLRTTGARSVTLTQGDSVQITLTSAFGLAGAVVKDEAGEVVYVASGNKAGSTNLFAVESTGNYTISCLANGYGTQLSYEVIERAKIQLNPRVAANHEEGTSEKTEKISFKEFTYTITKPGSSEAIPFMLLKDGTISLPNKYNGVRLTLKAKHQSDNGKNVFAWRETTTPFTPGSDTTLTFTARKNGQAYGQTSKKTDDLRVYIYNADGNYVGAAPITSDDDHTTFTTNPLPKGTYALILIRDIGGKYNFKNISDFRKNNLRNTVDYVQYDFQSELGLIKNFLGIKVPSGPALELTDFDEKAGYFSQEASAPVGSIVEFCLFYGVTDTTKGRITDLSAVLSFTENCTLPTEFEG